ncbi:MAG: beta-lactamase family protein [Verrucomicrobiaceae bacterium]|nr:beta-lactamase family protein [Verrucomicrobiaceae bacterium]
MSNRARWQKYMMIVSAGVLLSACGGGGGSGDSPPPQPVPPSTPPGPTTAERASAATQTADTNGMCTVIQPFYWEIGDKTAALASGSVGGSTYTATTVMPIASASKWIFGSYVVQLRAGQLNSADISALTMRSGYTSLGELSCVVLPSNQQDAETVSDCFHADGNDAFDVNAVDHFFYNGGHFQKLAVDLGLGNDNNASLQAHIQSQLGSDFAFSYGFPQLAGGVSTSAANYAVLLRKILGNQLFMHDRLGSNAVCTNLNAPFNATTCPQIPLGTPSPSTESWHYSLGHWLEDDPTVGDGAFSSPGAFGFYPWIDASKTYYGVLARKGPPGSGFDSASCGRLIRKAWVTATVQ